MTHVTKKAVLQILAISTITIVYVLSIMKITSAGCNISSLNIIFFITTIFLLSIVDIIEKEVILELIITSFIVKVIVLAISYNTIEMSNLLVSLVSTVIFLSGYKLISKAIGFGDLLILSLSILFIGLKYSLLILTISLVLASIIGGAYLIIFRKGRFARIPFIPFVSISLAIIILGENI